MERRSMERRSMGRRFMEGDSMERHSMERCLMKKESGTISFLHDILASSPSSMVK